MHKELINKQIQLEKSMLEEGISNFKSRVSQIKGNRNIIFSPGGKKLIEYCLLKYVPAMEQYIEEGLKGIPGRNKSNLIVTTLQKADLEITAFIVFSCLFVSYINTAGKFQKLTHTAFMLGNRVIDEINISYIQKENRTWYNILMNSLKHFKDYQTKIEHIKKQVLGKEFTNLNLSKEERTKLGLSLIYLLFDTIDCGTIKTLQIGKKRISVIEFNEEFLNILQEENNKHQSLYPIYKPCVIPPKEWTNPINGGYHFDLRNKFKLVSNTKMKYLKQYFKKLHIPEVYETINYLQNIPFKINKEILDIINILWNTNPSLPLGEIPPRVHTRLKGGTKLDKILDIVQEKINNSKLYKHLSIINLAEEFKNFENIYFPIFLDFRGRIYYRPTHLNPQSLDLAKALLLFGGEEQPYEEKPFFIHGANCYGLDKLSYEERIDWVKENKNLILSIGRQPLETQDLWLEVDKPFQFLSFCIEFYKIYELGKTTTNIIIYSDGSCNGIQHFSALTLNEDTGYYCNLKDTDFPLDLYNYLATKLKEELEKDKSNKEIIAKEILDLNIINRKFMKSPVMVYPYGGTYTGLRQTIVKFIEEEMNWKSKKDWTTTYEKYLVSKYLTDKVMYCLETYVSSCKEIMDYLKEIVKEFNNKDLPIIYKLPDNFTVIQNYTSKKSRHVQTHLLGKVFKSTLRINSERIDKRKQSMSISPNFIHSLDSYCLRNYISICKEQGITNLAVIHDSYGTTSNFYNKSFINTRVSFFNFYNNYNINYFTKQFVEQLNKEIKFFSSFGNLKIEEVLKSLYFFS